ncbi:hypothetical protein JYU34_000594 [Plutella xylostella]|uniref:Reverse transcriptase domain-containing protein n=1 Tax=Plutella xylostella TaxID=51655 RepID=A0ABQ7R834_PLUXY|nr:hypothetical protein JYU34_000594 [Plutella xylostella]
MPTDKTENFIEFIDCMSEMNAIIENQAVDSVFMLGDWNSHPGESFCKEMLSFCSEQNWLCADMAILPPDTYTYISEAHNCKRWLDHCIVTGAAWRSVVSAKVHYDVFWSDHFPLEVVCDINIIKPKIVPLNPNRNQAIWGERDVVQTNNFTECCNLKLKEIDIPRQLVSCCDGMCGNVEHHCIIDELYGRIVSVLRDAAVASAHVGGEARRGRPVCGWNKHVREAHSQARHYFNIWALHGKPSTGRMHEDMSLSRKKFKAKLKWCQNNQDQIKMDIIASHHQAKNFGKFWKETNKLNPRAGLPVSVDGVSEPREIANAFLDRFKVQSPLGPAASPRVLAPEGRRAGDAPVRVSAKQVAKIIKQMSRGKSPGHDGLSIEHLQYAGVHLPRVLALFYTHCIRHAYLPEELMKTIVVPVIKDKTGDASDKANYRPISLATILAKVLDSVLDSYLEKHLKLHDAQFGFRAGLSTESVILCLKHTVRYYTDRSTPVYACFLDLSKAFDLVSYDILWDKLYSETDLPES